MITPGRVLLLVQLKISSHSVGVEVLRLRESFHICGTPVLCDSLTGFFSEIRQVAGALQVVSSIRTGTIPMALLKRRA